MDLLLDGLDAVLFDKDLTQIPVPPHLEQVALSQSLIGWKHLLRGRISIHWARLQQEYMGDFDPKKNGQTWATTVIQEILQGWLDLWTLRNKDRHGHDHQTKQQAATAQAHRELEQLYSLKGQVLPEHEWLFDIPLQARLGMKTYYIRAYLTNWKPVLEESYKERLATG